MNERPEDKSNPNNFLITSIDTDDDELLVPKRGLPRFLRDKYIMGDIIGSGSFSVVQEAVHMQSLRRVAVKAIELRRVLRQFHGETQHSLRKLKKEADLLRRMEHQNVIKVSCDVAVLT